MRELRTRHAGDVLVLGSPKVVRWLFGRDLLDVLALAVLSNWSGRASGSSAT